MIAERAGLAVLSFGRVLALAMPFQLYMWNGFPQNRCYAVTQPC